MLMPKRTKYRKPQRISYEGHAKGNTKVTKGEYGLQAKTAGYVAANQIEAARIAMTRYMKRGGRVYINIFPQLARTRQGLGVRQGTGKGTVDHWSAVVKAGTVMFEVGDVDEATAREALRLASHKIGLKCKFVKKEESGVNDEN